MELQVSETTLGDLPYIQPFLTSTTRAWFGHTLDLFQLREKSYISLTQKDDQTPLSIICLDDFPPVLSIPRDSWLQWMREVYKCSYLSYKNAVFIHLLAWGRTYTSSHLEQLLIYIYEHYYYIEHILVVIPLSVDVHFMLDDYFRPVKKKAVLKEIKFNLPIYVNSRSWTLPSVDIRLAEINDVDQILALLLQKQKDVKETYGHQLVTELYQPENTECRFHIVALIEGEVVAFMLFDTRVQHDLLEETFDLSLYKGCSSSNCTTVNDPFAMDQGSNTTIRTERSIENDVDETESPTGKAFAIAVFAVNSKHEYIIPNILQTAFRTYCPDCDYCVISVKSDQISPLLKHMDQVLTKEHMLYPHELYALSKAAVLGVISVRPSEPKDGKTIAWLLDNYEEKQDIFKQVFAYLQCPEWDPGYKMMTICVESQFIIGFALISRLVESKFVDSHFHIQRTVDYRMYHPDDQALIKYFILSPPFLSQARFIVKEMLRQTDLSCLIYAHYMEQPPITIPEIIKTMFPVKPRAPMDYPPPAQLNNNVPPHIMTTRKTPSALYLITKRMTSLIHYTRHVKVLVLGASPLGLSFLETLIFNRTPADPCFTRITLMTKHGLWQRPHKYQDLAESMMVNNGLKMWHYVASLGISMWVTVRMGIVTKIQPREKLVTSNFTEWMCSYQYMFILTQLAPQLLLQHHIMNKVLIHSTEQIQGSNDKTDKTETTRRGAFHKFLTQSEGVSHERCGSKLNCMEEQKPVGFPPILENVFCIANIVNAGKGLDYVEELVKKKQKVAAILIIGQSLAALACVQSVLALGTREAGIEVILIEPNNIEKTNTRYSNLNNPHVSRAMIQILNENKIRYVHNVQLYDHSMSSSNTSQGRVTWVMFESTDSMLFTLHCSAVFLFEPTALEVLHYESLYEAKVLVQNKIIINEHNQTSEPDIYAAGLCTKYRSRIFGEDTRYFNQLEIGEDLGKRFIKFLDSNHTHDKQSGLPKFKRSLVEGCILPGNYNYIHVYQPGQRQNREYIKPGDTYEITTGSISDEDPRGYFQIIFNRNKVVTEIFCVSRQPLRISNIRALCGKHAALLNNILERHAVSPITDLYAYFDQAWAMALYYDKFNSFFTTIDSLFHQPNGRYGKTMRELIERIHTRPETPERIDEEIRKAFAEFEIFRQDFDKERLLDVLVAKVVQYLQENKEYLPMYASTEKEGYTIPEEKLGKDKLEDLDETCRHFDVPVRGYNLPHTEPVMGRALDCIRDMNLDLSTRDQDKFDISVITQVQDNKSAGMANMTQIDTFMCPGIDGLGVIQETYHHELKARGLLDKLNKNKNKTEQEQATNELK
ncbi:hypothetical protein WDU94_005140 [Cyamophila willieti]